MSTRKQYRAKRSRLVQGGGPHSKAETATRPVLKLGSVILSVEWFAVLICTFTQSNQGTLVRELETLFCFFLSKQQIPFPKKIQKSK